MSHYTELTYHYYCQLNEIKPALNQANTILTPTKRLASFVEHYCYKDQLGSVFTRKSVESFQAWLNQLWQDISLQQPNPPALLDPMQQHHYWFSCLNDHAPTTLLNQQATLQGLLQAWRLVNEWSLNYQHIKRNAFNQDQQLLVAIMTDYDKWCQNQHCIDQQSLAPWLSQHLTQAIVEQYPELVLLEFNYATLPPAYQTLLNKFQSLGGNINCYQRYNQPAQFYYCQMNNPETEIDHISNWFKQQVDNHPHGHFLWLVPELQSQRQYLLRHLKKTFGNNDYYTFNIGGHQPLADIPVIQTAIQIIQLRQKPLERSYIEYLLTSPYVAQQSQAPSEYALLRHTISTSLPPRISASMWQAFLIQQSDSTIGNLLYELDQTQLPQSATPEQWAEYFHQMLQILGWPGTRPLDSMEYQAINHWQQVLDTLCQLNSMTCQLWSFETALEWLDYIAQQTPYQSESPDHIQIDCLEPMEAVGLQYDGVWVMNSHQLAWPQPSHMNPFLPFNIQRQYDLPHARVDREQRFYNGLIEQILALSDTVQLSYARFLANDYQCHLSTLWAQHQPLLSQPQVIVDNDRESFNYQLQTLWDNEAPQVTDPQSIKGGNALLQAQAQCPFKAWASYRLYAQQEDTKGYLMSAQDKGILLHRALEHLWQNWADQHELQQTPEPEREQFIKTALQKASQPFIKQLPKRLLTAEIQRIHTILKQWLDFEAKQRAFFKIVALEHQTQINLDHLAITLKIDRIDQDANGESILIDYKSRAPSPNQWLGDRPEEPQMPLYTLSQSSTTISGLAYAEISAQSIKFKGWSTQSLPKCSKPPQSWDKLNQAWQTHLNHLAQQFVKGVAHIDPKRGELTCAQCHLTTFCRRLDQQKNHQ